MMKSANIRHVKWELTPVTLTGICNIIMLIRINITFNIDNDD